jgi:FkbM family methyltransferase
MPDFDRWFVDRGDTTLRFDYQINPKDIILDCGAYHGAWSRQIYDLFHCKIVAFEPIKAYYDLTTQALAGTDAIIYHAGIGPANVVCDISVHGDASSIMTHLGRQEQIKIVSVDDIIRDHSLSKIRLMKINIEGAEYDLLDYMIDTATIDRVEDIQVQFHSFIANSAERRQRIRDRLQKTHHLTYDYEFVWENWRLHKN